MGKYLTSLFLFNQ